MHFRLTVLISVVVLGATAGCAASEHAETGESAKPETVKRAAAPFVGTWRWSGSGHKLGAILLGEEHFIFHGDGTYAVLSVDGDGARECYDGTYTWSGADADGYGTIVFKSNHLRASPSGFEREVHFDGETLDFGPAGRYLRSAPVNDYCPHPR